MKAGHLNGQFVGCEVGLYLQSKKASSTGSSPTAPSVGSSFRMNLTYCTTRYLSQFSQSTHIRQYYRD